MAITWALTDIRKSECPQSSSNSAEGITPSMKRRINNWLPCPGKDDDQASTCSTGISTPLLTPSLSAPDLQTAEHLTITPPRNVEDFVTCHTIVQSPW